MSDETKAAEAWSSGTEQEALMLQPTPTAVVQRSYVESMRPNGVLEAMTLAERLAKSSFVPPSLKNKPGDILATIMYGAELGLAPLTAIHNVAIINGKPAVYGDGLVAVCQSSPAYEWHKEGVEGEGDKRQGFCIVKRRGNPEATKTVFTVTDAKRAGLWGKSGPWALYPDRMLTMRARGFALRDAFADALKGVITREEAEDFPGGDYPGPVVATVIPQAEVLQSYVTKAAE